MRKILCILLTLLVALPLSAQVDKREVRKGNRKFSKKNYKESELDYRRALVKDSTSFAATYDLASALYEQKDYQGAASTLEKLKDAAPDSPDAAKYYFNLGNTALQMEQYKPAMEAFKQSLLRNPGDLKAKENYLYAKAKAEDEDQQQKGDQGDKGDQDDQQDQKDQQDKQDQPQDQPQDQQKQEQPQPQKISPQQAQQMLQAMQAKEKETQEKVEKEKALKAQSRQKDKNW